ncbi:MAG: transcriptional regulator NrdR [Myxococcota bacterium]|nr:transcriptional regulator NrdR [Myxococcota bacterium]
MVCPFCRSDDTRVLDSRFVREQQATRRRRSCGACGRRFTTYERVERLLPVVVKRDGSLEGFQRDKVRVGLQIACRKRPVSEGQIEALITRVEQHFAEAAEREVDSKEIGKYVMTCLRDVDEVAYVRFASVYREFSDVRQFVTVLETLHAAQSGDK